MPSQAGAKTIRITIGTRPFEGGWTWAVFDQEFALIRLGTEPYPTRAEALEIGADSLRWMIEHGEIPEGVPA